MPPSALGLWVRRRVLYPAIPGLAVWLVILWIMCSNTQCAMDFLWWTRTVPGALVSMAISITLFGLLPAFFSLMFGSDEPEPPKHWHTKPNNAPKPSEVKWREQKRSPEDRKEKATMSENDAIQDALRNAIEERKKIDPMVGIKLGSNEVLQRLLKAMNSERGVHIESLLGVLGSLAGFACHMAVREELVDSGKCKVNEAFTLVVSKDGKTYYYGDAPNKPLAEDKYSVWGLMLGSLQHLGDTDVPDLQSIFSDVARKVGGDQFGVPDLPVNHRPGDLPIAYVKAMWKVMCPIIDNFCDKPAERPVLLGLSIQKAMEMGKDAIKPSLAVKIVMEYAVPTSKIGPEWLSAKA